MKSLDRSALCVVASDILRYSVRLCYHQRTIISKKNGDPGYEHRRDGEQRYQRVLMAAWKPNHGCSGGIAAIWKFSDQCTVIGYSRDLIDLKIAEPGQEEWRLTGYYGFPEQRRRREACNLLKALSRINNLPWCILGDFNDILDSSESGPNRPTEMDDSRI